MCWRSLGCAIFFGASLAASGAHASPATSCGGISDLNANVTGFNHYITSSSNFTAGDTITVTFAAGPSMIAYIFSGPTTFFNYSGNGGFSTTFTLGAGQTSLDIYYTNASVISATVTATCTSPTVANTDSDKARAVQTIGSRLVSKQSAASISDAANSAITGQILGEPTGLRPSLPPTSSASNLGGPRDEPGQERSNLGAGSSDVAAPMPRGQIRVGRLSLWSEARGTGILDRQSGAGGIAGSQINVTSGIGLQLRPGFVVGALSGYESFDYDLRSLGGNLKGDGYTGGLYVGGKIMSTAWFTLVGTYSRLAYDVAAGTASGTFDANRWMVSGTIAGRVPLARPNSYAEPSVNLLYLKETQDGWRDTLGIAQASREFDEGRFSVGSKFATDMRMSHGVLTPHVGAYADYYFGGNTDLPTGIDGIGVNHNWSLRTVAGISMAFDRGMTLKLDGSIGGIGDETKTYMLRAGFATRF